MPVYLDPRERVAIMAILEELKDYHRDADDEHLIRLVATEAGRHGIKPAISVPFARQLIEEEFI